MGERGQAVSFVLYKTSCPRCREEGHDRTGDNLGVYSDGHTFCYRCNYSTRKTKNNTRKTTYSFREPHNWSNTIPSSVFDYLRVLGLTLEEILKNRIQWDEAKKLLIFPVYDPNGNLVFYQGRYFGENKDHPKYITSGTVVGTYDIHWCSNPLIHDSIVIVEDFDTFKHASFIDIFAQTFEQSLR